MEWLNLIGRILFAMVFLLSGFNHLSNRESMTGYAASKGLPAAGAAVVVSGLVLIAASVMIILGIGRLWAAWALFWFLVATAFYMHAFWKEEDAMTRMNEMTHFLKDLALAGAALLIVWADYRAVDWPFAL